MKGRGLALVSFLVVATACAAGRAVLVTDAQAKPVQATIASPGTTATARSTTTSSEEPGAVLPGEPWLVFRWYPGALHLVRPDGTDRRVLDIGVSGEATAPTWSPDGNQIAFVVKDAAWPDGSIWTADPNGANAAAFYDGNGDCTSTFHPVWSPDGQRLSFTCYHDDRQPGSSSVAILDVTTMTSTEIATFEWPEFIDIPANWSPDGEMLAFSVITWDPTDTFVAGSVVAAVPSAGGTVERLTAPDLFGAHPDWSPDGSLLVFNTYDTGQMHGIQEPSNLYTIAPDGTGLRQVTTVSVDGTMRLGQPFWATHGSGIWVSVARDYEKDSHGWPKNTLGWVDAVTGEFRDLGVEGKGFRERPTG
ncbi:MAG: hypothetical protein OEO77_07775 [Acidimicrobiia bacterium]|nr:hypothetical protein [Acidimicrobiia bacterium]